MEPAIFFQSGTGIDIQEMFIFQEGGD